MLKRSPAAAGFAMVALLAMATCTSSAATSTNAVLIIDKSFDLTSADPHRDASETGALIAKALYSTLLTFEGGDQSTPVPWVAASYTSSEDARTFTFKLRHDVVFSDRSQLTSADVLYSLARVVKMKGGPSALLSGVNASAPDAYTVVLTSSDPNPGLPSVLTTPELAIVNAIAMNGKADGFLDGASAGSGPYVLESFSTFSDIELVANSRYWGPKPFYRKVVVRNMDPRTQLAYVGAGKDEIALDLSPIQAATARRCCSPASVAATSISTTSVPTSGDPPRRQQASNRCGGSTISGTPSRPSHFVPASQPSTSPATWAPA